MSASTSDSGKSHKSTRGHKRKLKNNGGAIIPQTLGPTEEARKKTTTGISETPRSEPRTQGTLEQAAKVAASASAAAADLGPTEKAGKKTIAGVSKTPRAGPSNQETPELAAVAAASGSAEARPAAIAYLAAAAASSVAVPAVAMEVPTLSQVVKAASDIPKLPTPKVLRPAVGKKTETSVTKNETAISGIGTAGPSYAQVSGSSSKSQFLEILGKYVSPRPPPLEEGKSRPKSDEGMQGVFNARWQDDRYGMHFEHIRGSAQSAYLKAISAVIPRENIFSFGLVGRGLVEVFTTNLKSATKLMLEGIEVGGRHLSACPVTVKPTRVTFSRVPMRTDHEDLVGFLKRFGTVHGKVRAIPLRVGDEGLGKGIFSTSREALISLNKGCVLPSGFYLSISGSRHWIGVETEAKCHACHQTGHFVAECPKRTRKAAAAPTRETPAAAVVPDAVVAPDATPTLLEPPVTKAPEKNPQEAQNKTASSGLIPTRETSSDEEATTSSAIKKKLRKRKPKSKASREEMPPPALPQDTSTSKRRHSGGETDSRSLKVKVVDAQIIPPLPSDTEMMALDGEGEAPLSGYESCNSSATVLSLDGHFEVTEELQGIPPEKLRSLLERLHYKKSSGKILSILEQELEDPRRILPQLRLLQRDCKKRQKYNDAVRCQRLHTKISSILAEKSADGSLLQ